MNIFKRLSTFVMDKIEVEDPIKLLPNFYGSMKRIAIKDATTEQKGSCILATDLDTIAGTGTGCVTPTNLKAKLGDQTANLVAVGKGNAQVIDWWSFFSSDSSASVNADPENKRFDIKTKQYIPTTKASFKAHYSANTAINIAAGTNYILTPNTVDYDVTSNFTVSTGTFTCLVAGDYIFGSRTIAASVGISLVIPPRVRLYAQSSTEIASIEDRVFNFLLSLGGIYVSIGNTCPMKLAVGQTVQLHFILDNVTGNYGIGGGTLNSLTSTYIYGYQL